MKAIQKYEPLFHSPLASQFTIFMPSTALRLVQLSVTICVLFMTCYRSYDWVGGGKRLVLTELCYAGGRLRRSCLLLEGLSKEVLKEPWMEVPHFNALGSIGWKCVRLRMKWMQLEGPYDWNKLAAIDQIECNRKKWTVLFELRSLLRTYFRNKAEESLRRIGGNNRAALGLENHGDLRLSCLLFKFLMQ